MTVQQPTYHLPDFTNIGSVIDIRKEQQADPVTRDAISWITNPSCLSDNAVNKMSRSSRRLWTVLRDLVLIDGVLYRQIHSPSSESPPVNQVVIPLSLQPQVLSHLHGDPLASHFSTRKTFQRSINLCYWPFIHRDIDTHCKTCRSCESRRNPTPRNKAPMKISNSTHPFQRVFADITELPTTSKNNRYILVVMDQFTKYVNP